MKNLLKYYLIFHFLFAINMMAQTHQVKVLHSDKGMSLQVNGQDFFINGMNWDYFPIGTNYNYSLWKQSDEIIQSALDTEMQLLQNMGVNVIRMYTGVPARWITYIYENYGIYTMLNHSFGRYGLNVDGAWEANTEYGDMAIQKLLMQETKTMVQEYKNTPGLLLYLLGNENNYGLFWEGAETEDIPIKDRKSTKRATAMYKLFNRATVQMKGIDQNHPVAICNGDLLFLEIIKKECPDIDIFGTNVYRGESFGDAFERVAKELNKPIMYTEFGADAFNVLENQEDQQSQAFYMVENWKEIYQNAAGLGKANNSIGGFTFQFSDGWWKYGQTKNLDTHDNNASWSNGGYKKDYKFGQNNMNEEWFGICAKGKTNARGLYNLYPRAAYYALKEVHQINPYNFQNAQEIAIQVKNVNLMSAVLKARGDKALAGNGGDKISISNLRAKFETYNTGGSLLTTPDSADPNANTYPNQTGFDHMQSYFIGVQGRPAPNVKAEANFNIVGNVAQNPINEIFYENRNRPVIVQTNDGTTTLRDVNRVQVYNASLEWDANEFDLRTFYRTGHYHWGYEGDFFGLYPEANYGPNLDLYNGEILGTEVDGKNYFKGLKLAFGPQLWWGANPALLLKYERTFKGIDFATVFHEDVDNAAAAISSIAIPIPKTRRLTLYAAKKMGKFKVELGGIWAGQPLNGRVFQYTEGSSGNYTVFTDRVQASDNWGGKLKITYSGGQFNWYAQSSVQGLVANGGADQTLTFTGWKLKDSGSGNQNNFLTGFTYNLGKFQIAPNFLWQKPLLGPMPNDVQAPGRLRNIQDDPFAVRANRETTAGEILITFDPTPATWMYEWDNDRAEDAKFAGNIGFIYRHHPTAQDAAVGFLSNRTSFAFPNSAPARDLWEIHSRLVSKMTSNLGFISNLYGGTAQANGSDARLLRRMGADLRMIYRKVKLEGHVKINDWGPFDYHRDFNLTYPTQLMLDLSTTVGKPDWFVLPGTRVGIRGTWRSLNEHSPRYLPNQTANTFSTEPIASPIGFDNGTEWEIRTYVHFNLGK